MLATTTTACRADTTPEHCSSPRDVPARARASDLARTPGLALRRGMCIRGYQRVLRGGEGSTSKFCHHSCDRAMSNMTVRIIIYEEIN